MIHSVRPYYFWILTFKSNRWSILSTATFLPPFWLAISRTAEPIWIGCRAAHFAKSVQTCKRWSTFWMSWNWIWTLKSRINWDLQRIMEHLIPRSALSKVNTIATVGVRSFLNDTECWSCELVKGIPRSICIVGTLTAPLKACRFRSFYQQLPSHSSQISSILP